MRNLRVLIVLFIAVVTISCSPVYSVSHDYDRGTDFTKLKTYSWLPLNPVDQISELNLERIQTAVNSQLESKGFKKVSKNPDFSIVVRVGTKEEYWDGSGYYGYRYARRIEAGTLLVDFVKSREHRLIWRGEARAAVGSRYSPEKLDKLVDEAVARILKEFPPSPPE